MKNDDSYQIVADLKKSIWNHKTVLGICAVSGHPQLVKRLLQPKFKFSAKIDMACFQILAMR